MQKSTRLLVTHQKQFLPLCDRIVIMNNGFIEVVGTWEELSEHPVLKTIENNDSENEVKHSALAVRLRGFR